MPTGHAAGIRQTKWEGVPRGYVLTYRPGDGTACPGCGRRNWHVGRNVAECAFCATALPLDLESRALNFAAQGLLPLDNEGILDRLAGLWERAMPRFGRNGASHAS